MPHEARLAAALLAAADEWEMAIGRDVFRSFVDFLRHKQRNGGMTWLEILEKTGDTPEERKHTVDTYLGMCERGEADFLSEDALPFLAHIQATDTRLWLDRIAPILHFWPREDRARFDELLEEHLPKPPLESECTQPIGFEDFSAEDLRLEDVPDTRWIVEGLLPEGLASLAGRPKQGKSWLALNIAISVAMGGKALGEHAIPHAGSVLYLALEDNKSRLKRRTGQLMRQVVPWPINLKFSLFSPRMGAGFAEALRLWLESNSNPALCVIDMYTKIAERRKKKSNNSDYDDIYDELGPIQSLADEFHVAILLVMHLNKTADVEDQTARIMGSTAFAGATVTNLILRRLKNTDAADGILSPNGKDIEDEDDIALVFDAGIWTSRGNADLYNQSQQRLDILDALYMAQGKETTPKDIAEAIGKNAATTRKLLQKLKEDGLITKDTIGGLYHLTNAGADVLKARTVDEDRARNLDRFENDSDDDDSDDDDNPYPPHWSDTVDPKDFF